MRRLPRPLLAVLLVLVHVLGPALHQLQHAASALVHDEGFGLCGHACCHAAAEADEARERPVAWLDAHERRADAHDHDCDLCSQLHRLHGILAPAKLRIESSVAAAGAVAACQPASPAGRRPAMPPARAPPRTRVC